MHHFGRGYTIGLPLLAVVLLWLIPTPAHGTLGVQQRSYRVSMRDGTQLATDVYLPRIPHQAVPVILVRTPYGRDQIPRAAAWLVCRAGRALVVQDVRAKLSYAEDAGPSDSERWASERRDGHDTINWIANQSWCDGNIGSWGPSALGITQNLFAPDAPDALKAQYVLFAASNLYSQVAYQGGAYRQELLQGWFRQYHFNQNAPLFREHYKYDAFWEALNTESSASRVNVPAVFVGGWYDAFLQGTINSFVALQNSGGPLARGNCRLIVGPWMHDDAERLARPRGTRQLPAIADPFRFMDYWLKCLPSGVPCDHPVQYFVMGPSCESGAPGNFWRRADQWPPPAHPITLYLQADGSLRPARPRSASAARSYDYDPHDPVPTRGGQNMFISRGPWDQRPVESRSDVLIFTSEMLEQPLEVTGHLEAKLFVSSDCPDTDFTVKLTDVYPDGRSMLITDGILRARFRRSFEREDFLEPGEVYELPVDLWSTSYVFNTGHQLRVAVSSSNAPRFAPNPNTGAPRLGVGASRVAHNTVHLSSQFPSQIVLPVVLP